MPFQKLFAFSDVPLPDRALPGVAFALIAPLPDAGSPCIPSRGEPQPDPLLCRRCRLLEQMVERVVDLLPAAGILRVRDPATNSRQITIYLCHVSLGVSQVKIARIFGLSRTAVRQTCQTMENRRDDRHLDDILEIIGRLARDAVLRAEVRDDR